MLQSFRHHLNVQVGRCFKQFTLQHVGPKAHWSVVGRIGHECGCYPKHLGKGLHHESTASNRYRLRRCSNIPRTN